jgi:hypothetical protein
MGITAATGIGIGIAIITITARGTARTSGAEPLISFFVANETGGLAAARIVLPQPALPATRTG